MKNHLVAALVHPPVPAFELGCVAEIFGRERPELNLPWYNFAVGTLAPGTLPATGGLAVHVQHGLDIFERADTIVVSGWNSAERPHDALVAMLRAAHVRGARIISVCTGAFLLAEAGLLNGKRATTHWMYASLLQDRFPDVAVDPDVLYVDEGRLVTAAGSAAGLDMLLHIVRRDHGARICNAVAKRLNIPPYREGGQSQFAERPVPTIKDTKLSDVIAWMRAHSTHDLPIDILAGRAAMSERTFFRKFREATGQTPYDWLIGERIAVARELLETSKLSLEQVAYAAGFGAPERLRPHFKRAVGCTPNEYRQRFRSAQAPAMDVAA